MTNGRGLLDKKEPHTSFTQVVQFDAYCEQGWYERYSRRARKPPGFLVADGEVVDRMFKEITMRAAGAEQDIGEEDIEPILAKYAKKVSSVGMYRRICEGMRRFAEHLNGPSIECVGGYDRPARLNVRRAPFLLRAAVRLGKRQVALWGELDALHENEQKEPELHECKLTGTVLGQEDLEEDLQMDIYNFAYRQQEKYWGSAWKVWHSILRGVKIDAKADVADMRATENYLAGVLDRMYSGLAAKRFKRTVNIRCDECPGARKCEPWIADQKGQGAGEPISATLRAYKAVVARAAALAKMRDRVKEQVKLRVQQAGGELEEDGFHGRLAPYPAKLDQRYLGMDRDQLLNELRTPARTVLLVKARPVKKR